MSLCCIYSQFGQSAEWLDIRCGEIWVITGKWSCSNAVWLSRNIVGRVFCRNYYWHQIQGVFYYLCHRLAEVISSVLFFSLPPENGSRFCRVLFRDTRMFHRIINLLLLLLLKCTCTVLKQLYIILTDHMHGKHAFDGNCIKSLNYHWKSAMEKERFSLGWWLDGFLATEKIFTFDSSGSAIQAVNPSLL